MEGDRGAGIGVPFLPLAGGDPAVAAVGGDCLARARVDSVDADLEQARPRAAGIVPRGGDLDFCNSYAQRGNLPVIEHVVSACLALFPSFGRLKIMRTWGGVCDMTMDGSPIIGPLPVKGLTMTGGWCYGGFKATPASGWLHAYTIALGAPHPLNAPFSLERFARGATIDEKGAGPIPWAH